MGNIRDLRNANSAFFQYGCIRYMGAVSFCCVGLYGWSVTKDDWLFKLLVIRDMTFGWARNFLIVTPKRWKWCGYGFWDPRKPITQIAILPNSSTAFISIGNRPISTRLFAIDVNLCLWFDATINLVGPSVVKRTPEYFRRASVSFKHTGLLVRASALFL